MTLFGFVRRRGSAPVARERLHILLEYERSMNNQRDLVLVLREKILAVICQHVAIDPDKVQIRVDRGATVSTLEVDIEIPNTAGLAAAAQV